jgi:AcrR family transcriptional regulator
MLSEVSRERARPLPPDERREAILDAVLPIIKEHGRNASTRQLAEAAGVAEGTLFRAFGDKDSLFDAVARRVLDPQPIVDSLRAIDPTLRVEQKLELILTRLRENFSGVFRIMASVHEHGRPHPHRGAEVWIDTLIEMLREHADELTAPVETVAYWLRLQAFAAEFPAFNTPHPFHTKELTRLISSGAVSSSAKDS